MESFVDGPYRTFTEETPGELTNKEGYLVEVVPNKTTVRLFTNGLAIGVVHQKLQGSNDVSIRMLGKGGTVKVVAGGAINTPARVKAANGGKVVDINNGGVNGRSVGIKISPAAAAANNDLIEIVDVVEVVP